MFSRALLCSCATIVASVQASPSLAAERAFDIPAQPLASALARFGVQSGRAVVFDPRVVARRSSRTVRGRFEPDVALRRLLNDAPVSVRSTASGFILSGSAAPLGANPDDGRTPDQVPPARLQGAAIAEVIVTGSRVARSGFTTPTPTTVVGADLMNASVSTSVAGVLQGLPAVKADYSSANTGPRSTNSPGAAFANLRSLGANRTLTLIDSRRVAPTSLIGAVDLNLMPAILIARVDVVTGGASAAYGSDAVAGVANVVLKHDLEGVIGDFSLGRSARNDNRSHHVGLAAGMTFAQGRGHFQIGGEYDRSLGVGTPYTRAWGRQEWGVMPNPAINPSNQKTPASPGNLLVSGYRPSNLSTGGVIVSGPLRGLQFLGGGATAPFEYGSTTGPSFMAGGQNYGLTYANTTLLPPLTRANLLGRIDFRAGERLKVWAEAAWADTHHVARGGAPRFTAPLTVNRDNPFLPASVAAAMQAANLSTIAVGRTSFDLGFSENNARSTLTRYALGAEGSMPGGWTWDAYAQRGRTHFRGEINNTLYYPAFFRSIDAVRAPSGEIVCRSTLTAPNDGCAPADIFGPSAIGREAAAYFMGDNWFEYDYVQKVVALNLRGSPASSWAGPISVALGLEDRRESVESASDPRSIGCNGADQFNTCWYLTNQKPLFGKVRVTEAYVEAVTPLLAGRSYAKRLELDTAVRRTNYSTSGLVTTWKLGLNYAVNDQLRLRATRSRDIRAPNLQNLYSPGNVGVLATVNPATGFSQVIPGIQTSNPDLDPEKADTTTFGIVLRPAAVPGLDISVDGYRISMRDAINTLALQAVVNACHNGAPGFCGYVTLSNGAVATSREDLRTNTIAAIERRTLNISALETAGYDLEVSYRRPLETIFERASGEISLRLWATYVQRMVVSDGSGARVDRAGEVGDAGLGAYGVPKWRGTLLATYANGPLTLTGSLRYIDGGRYNALYGPGDIDDNRVASQLLTDLSGQYTLINRGGAKAQLYGVVQNLFDSDPPVAPTFTLGTNAAIFDTLGRTFKLGLRFSF